jgi:alpha-1,3-rhamnosyl/mannosyltransferase
MACGTPVMTSDVSSLPEVAGSAGLCLPPQDASVWTAALQRAYHDGKWREDAAHQGLEEAKRYRWRETATQTVRSYQRALGLM